MPDISIIVRTKNEERWIGHCLAMLFKQSVADIEVILVDNASDDHTVQVASRFPIKQVVRIDDFLPGRALNDGIRASSGRYIVCLSAHCIPKANDWLACLRRNFEQDDRVAGVYGRQLPLSFTDGIDKRDLMMLFGNDRRVQIKDYFFHNANSMLRREIWDAYPFDEQVTNVEDRLWAKAVIDAGYRLVYEPEAGVYHHHGLHQGNSRRRVDGVVSVIERVDRELLNDLPASMRPGNVNIAAVVPVRGHLDRSSKDYELFTQMVEQLRQSAYVRSVYVVADDASLAQPPTRWLNRTAIAGAESIGLDGLMRGCLEMIEGGGDFPEALLYVNYDYLHRPPGIFDELVFDAQYKGCDTVFPGLTDYGHYWLKTPDGIYQQSDSSMEVPARRQPVFRALYGLGCLTSAALIRNGTLVGGKVGILPIARSSQALRLKDVS